AAGVTEAYSMRAVLGRVHHVDDRVALRPGQAGDSLDHAIAVVDDEANGCGLRMCAIARRCDGEQHRCQHNSRRASAEVIATAPGHCLTPPRVELPTRATGPNRVAAHSSMMATSASRPSVNAAGPGCRMSGDLISRRKPSRTAGTSAKPGRAATLAGTNFLPHQEPTMMSGLGAVNFSPPTMRAFAVFRRGNAGKTTEPPAVSMRFGGPPG